MAEKVSEFTERGETVELFIEEYEHPEGVELDRDLHTLTMGLISRSY